MQTGSIIARFGKFWLNFIVFHLTLEEILRKPYQEHLKAMTERCQWSSGL